MVCFSPRNTRERTRDETTSADLPDDEPANCTGRYPICLKSSFARCHASFSCRYGYDSEDNAETLLTNFLSLRSYVPSHLCSLRYFPAVRDDTSYEYVPPQINKSGQEPYIFEAVFPPGLTVNRAALSIHLPSSCSA